jgi:cobalt/nickel transport system permease protein
MALHLDDPYLDNNSVFHRAPALAKFSAAIAFVVAVVALPRFVWSAIALAGAVLIVFFLIARLPLKPFLKRLLLVEPFVVLVATTSLFQDDGRVIFGWLVVRGTLCVLAMMLLVSTTRFSDLLGVLQQLRLPSILTTTISLMYRYLFLIVSELNRLSRARTSRTFSPGRWRTWNSYSSAIGFLLVRTTVRAEKVFAAMSARGWKT